MLRIREACREVGLSKDTIYRKVRVGDFPAPFRISKNAVAWRTAEVLGWLDSRRRTTEVGLTSG